MSDSKKKAKKTHASIKETADKLRTLADELDRGVIIINDEECLITPDTQVNISLKTKDDKLSYKLDFKLPNHSSSKNKKSIKKNKQVIQSTIREKIVNETNTLKDNKTEEYKNLKNRMSQDFKTIMTSCIKEKYIPEPALVERFHSDSKAMCKYPDKGEEFYEIFLKQIRFFYNAFKNSDLSAMSSAITSLGRIKKECHDKHK